MKASPCTHKARPVTKRRASPYMPVRAPTRTAMHVMAACVGGEGMGRAVSQRCCDRARGAAACEGSG